MTLSAELRETVRRRAEGLCEYCRLPAYASVLPHQIDHINFRIFEARILGLTAEGRTSVDLLDMNGEDRVQLRHALIRRGWSP